VDALDRYFREQAGQDVRRRATACFVALEIATNRIAGFYTLAAAGVLLAKMPVRLAKRLPRYPAVPVARLGRLAVAGAYHGRKLGGALLWDAVERASRSEVAVYALVVDAKDQQAQNFYLHHGFVPFNSVTGYETPKLRGVRSQPPNCGFAWPNSGTAIMDSGDDPGASDDGRG
jgi:ribosomal protein S18 acetylase RimI-like enzyme